MVPGATTAVADSLYPVSGREPASKDGRRVAAPASRRPVAVDLFAGAGGFSLGFEQAGFDILASIEYDPIHCAVHAYNFPRTEIVCADIRTLRAERIREAIGRGWRRHKRPAGWDGEVDVVVGGPPCQGFSTGGKRRFDDVRNELVFGFARLVGELKPRYFVLENVPGMSSLAVGPEDDAPKLIDVLLKDFAARGYVVAPPKILNAAEFGVPQQRRRLIVLGARSGCGLPAYPQAQTAPRGRRPTAPAASSPDRPYCPTVWDAIGDLPDVDRTGGLRFTDETALSKRAIDRMHTTAAPYARTLLGLQEDREDRSYRRIWDETALTSSLRTIHAPTVTERFAATPQGHPEPISRLVRLHPQGISSTLRAGTHYERGSFNAPRPIHPVSNRVISVREAARLHSFPDWFRLHWTKWHGFRQVGNAIPPRLGRAIARELMSVLDVKPKTPKAAISLGDPELVALENLQAAERFGADLESIPRNALRKRAETVGS